MDNKFKERLVTQKNKAKHLISLIHGLILCVTVTWFFLCVCLINVSSSVAIVAREESKVVKKMLR